eukprot:761161-Hanusia_phi.AAC.5
MNGHQGRELISQPVEQDMPVSLRLVENKIEEDDNKLVLHIFIGNTTTVLASRQPDPRSSELMMQVVHRLSTFYTYHRFLMILPPLPALLLANCTPPLSSHECPWGWGLAGKGIRSDAMRSPLVHLLMLAVIGQSSQNLRHDQSAPALLAKLQGGDVGFVASPGCWTTGRFVCHGLLWWRQASCKTQSLLGRHNHRFFMSLRSGNGAGGSSGSKDSDGHNNKRFLKVLQDDASHTLGDALNFVTSVRAKVAEEGAEAAASLHVRQFNNAIKLCSSTARRGSGKAAVSTALSIFDLMREIGVRPNSYTFLFLMDTCAKAGAEEEALLVAEMQQDSGCRPTEFFYSSFISLYKNKASAGDRRAPQKVLALLDEMKERHVPVNEFVLTSAISTCAAAANKLGLEACLKISRNLLSSMDRSGVKVTEAPYNALMSGCAKCAAEEASAARECWEILKEMKMRGIKPNQRTYNTLMDCCARSAD